MTHTPSSCTKNQLQTPLVVRFATEFIATALAMFVIYTFSSLATAMYGINLLMIAIGTGITYAVAISIAAKISGGHLNPAVTVASMLTGRTSYLAGLGYIIAQILGALAAAGVFIVVLPQTKMVKDANWFASVVNGFENASISANQLKSVNTSFGVITALLVEVIAVVLIVATAMSHTDDNGATHCDYATHMGLAYAAGTLITYQITGSGLNPARSTGIAVLANSRELEVKPLTQLWVFWIAPIFAAALVGFVILLAKLLATSAKQIAATDDTTHTPAAASTTPAAVIDQTEFNQANPEQTESYQYENTQQTVDTSLNAANNNTMA